MVATISEILTTPNFSIPAKGKPLFDVIHTLIPGTLDFGAGKDFRDLHIRLNSGNSAAAEGDNISSCDTLAGAVALLLLFVM